MSVGSPYHTFLLVEVPSLPPLRQHPELTITHSSATIGTHHLCTEDTRQTIRRNSTLCALEETRQEQQTERHWVVMAALEEAISPGRALEIVGDGTDGLSEEAVHENLRDSAVTIIRHEQLMMRHLGKDFAPSDPLLFFVYQVHGARADPETIIGVEIFSSRPFLSLGFWDSIYYSLILKICEMEESTKDFHSQGVLHNHGNTGDSLGQPYSVDDFRRLLTTTWRLLTHPGLLSTLETAVRYQHLAETYRNLAIDHDFRQAYHKIWSKHSSAEKAEMLLHTPGMIDVLRLPLPQIHSHLQQTCVEKNLLACLEELGPSASTSPSPPPPLEESTSCCCLPSCTCRIVCQFGIHACECATSSRPLSSLPTTTAPPPVPPTAAAPAVAAPAAVAVPAPPPPIVFYRRPRLVSAGGSTPLAARASLVTALPEPEERGFAISREQYAALPLPRGERTAISSSSGGGGGRRRSVAGWVKKMVGMGMGKK